MGNNCSPTNLDSYASSTFDVYNVDAQLFKHSKGKIQITNTNLILLHESAETEPMKWPLTGVRRYGFHKNIFLFECGRKCPSGEGLFAFKCNKAKRLNDSLHKAIVNNATQLCNLQENTQRTAENSISSAIVSSAANTENDSSDYTLLNEPEDQNNFTQIKKETSTETNRRLNTENTSSPYYVNDSLIRLPLNLSSQSTNTQIPTSYNNYVNSEQIIDPCILHITNKFTRMKCAPEYYTYTRSKKVTKPILEPSNLNYILMEKVPKVKQTSQRSSSDINYITNKQEAQIEYVMIDKVKTPAAQFSKNQIEKKRMEYAMLAQRQEIFR